jgi:uncharacterized protein DUF29
MTRAKATTPASQAMLHLKSLRTLTDDLAFFGRTVGPRRGPDARTKRQKENYCLRRWLIAMASQGRLSFPVIVENPGPGDRSPDFLLTLDDQKLGVEVTEAGAATWQEWLSQAKPATPGNTIQLFPKDGYVGDEPEQIVIHDVVEAVNRKSVKRAQGVYRMSPVVDLLIYENSAGGLMANKHRAVESLRRILQDSKSPGAFRQIHLIFGDDVFLDIAGPSFEQVDVSKTHADDWSAWLEDQARLLRQRNFNAVDADNLAEELDSLARSDQRALKSQIRRLLMHLLKCAVHPKKRTKSWVKSIRDARDQIDSILEENPSFENRYLAAVEQEYPKARDAAAQEMNVPTADLPPECPFSIDSLRDKNFLPGSEG